MKSKDNEEKLEGKEESGDGEDDDEDEHDERKERRRPQKQIPQSLADRRHHVEQQVQLHRQVHHKLETIRDIHEFIP